MGETTRVLLFVQRGCPHCDAARQDLQGRGVPFQERDVSDPRALADMLRQNGRRRRVPTLVEGGHVRVGWGGKSSPCRPVPHAPYPGMRDF